MSQHWKSLLVVLVIIGAIVFFYRGDKSQVQSNPLAVAVTEATEAAAPQPEHQVTIAAAPAAVEPTPEVAAVPAE